MDEGRKRVIGIMAANGTYFHKTIYQMGAKANTPYGRFTFDSAGNL
jgi:hypothetical protein